MAFTYIFMIGFYWVYLSGTVYLAGALSARLFITVHSGAAGYIHPEKRRPFGETAIVHIITVSVLTLVASVIHVLLHCAVMTGTSLSEVWNVLPIFLMKTRYGVFSLIRMGLLAVILSVILYSSKKNTGGTWGTAFVCTAVLLITLAMSGHQGSKGYMRVPFFLDIVHVLAISLWIGGLFFICSGYSRFCTMTERDCGDAYLALIQRFSQIATVCVILVLLTGSGLYVYSFKNLSMVITTRYGIVLLVKTGLALVLMAIGGINKFYLLPGLAGTDTKEWTKICSIRGRLFTSMTVEVCLGLAILMMTSVLTHLSPGE